MGDLTAHFSESEFACKDTFNTPAPYIPEFLLLVLEDLREHFNAVVTITSGYRNEFYNAMVGGALNSSHLYNDPDELIAASDVKVDGIKPSEVFKYLDGKYGDKISLGKYLLFTHIDTRSKYTGDRSRRW